MMLFNKQLEMIQIEDNNKVNRIFKLEEDHNKYL